MRARRTIVTVLVLATVGAVVAVLRERAFATSEAEFVKRYPPR
jgi:hypothetical protein